jgi:FkbM family methyltransferase
MSFLSTFGRRFHTLTRLIDNPHLAAARKKGISLPLYESLTQPWLINENIATVLDIGANTGQFAMAVRTAMPQAHIYSFEPLPDCFQQLQKQMAGIESFSAFNIGLGESTGALSFERNSFSASSSFLSMAETHKTAFPFTRESQTIKVKVERLDDVARKLDLKIPMLIKIDVQGYEDRVLRGGEATIKRARILIVETSFEVLYQGQALFDDIYSLMRSWGFRFAGTMETLSHPVDGRMLQADSVFVSS